jgi:hypothetical protein
VKITKNLFYVLALAMLIGGIMGIVKGLVPNITWFSFRHLLGMGGTFKEDIIPSYAVIYGVFMAVLEIAASILLLTKKRIAIKFSIITMSINALGCVIAILLGDILAIGSLLTRIFAIYILIKARDFILLDKQNS